MDVGAFVQENKRWLIACAIGGLCWLIASSVIAAVYNVGRVATSPRQLGAPTGEVYLDAALSAAVDERDALRAERERLERELAFQPAPKYREWSGDADQHLFLVGRELRQAVQRSASDRDVQFDDGGLTWEVPQGVDEIRRVLLGLDLVDAIQARLFAAHDRARAYDENAEGLSAIVAIKLEPQRMRRSMGRGRRDEVDLQDLIDQQTVTVHFQADEATIAGFLEACREPGRTIVLDRWQILKPQRPGEACTVKGTLAAIVFRGEEK